MKKEYLKHIDNIELAKKFDGYNYLTDTDKEMEDIRLKFEKIVFKEARSGGGYSAIGWENINSYLRYHSGIIYRWFAPKEKMLITLFETIKQNN